MVMRCEEVWKDLSNYIDNEVDAPLRAALKEHFAGCRNCASLLEGTRNVVRLYGDERMFAPPAGFGKRMTRRVANGIEGRRGGVFGWVMAFGAATAFAVALYAAQLSGYAIQPQRSEHSHPAVRLPARLVAVNADGKTFHVAGCPFLHGKWKLVPAAEAIRDGYTPCVRCMREALTP